jgi:ergothioneine biosynthesis protein EgtB
MNQSLKKYQAVRKHSINICSHLAIEDFVAQPIADVSPPKWHLAHVTWFFETFLLVEHCKGYKVFDPQFAFLFNSYYVSAGERMLRPDRGNMTRPTVSEIYKYREYVDQAMEEFLSTELSDTLSPILEIGLNHEQQHQELLLYDIKYILGHNPLFPVYDKKFEEYRVENLKQQFIPVKKGNYKIGHQGAGFAFDNERERHEVHLEGAQISNKLVTNGEYAEFIESGAYADHQFWHSDARTWIEENAITAPLYWHKEAGEWHHYTLAGYKKIVRDAPVMHISFYEAFAFAEWKGMRLPTEFEWEVVEDQLDWGQRWEFTGSAYLPYPGYKRPPGAIGEYNGKFMVNQMVLRGSSLATAENHSRKTYRNFFHPHLQWQMNGIRLAKDL